METVKHSLPEIPRDGLQVWLCDQGSNKGQPARRNNAGARTVRCTDTKMKEGGREDREQTDRGKGDSFKEKMKETQAEGALPRVK